MFYCNDKRRLTYIMAILFKRIQQGYTVKFSEWVIKNTMQSIYYKRIFEESNVIEVNKNRP